MKKGNIFYEMIGITLATALVAASVYFFLIPSDLPLGSISGLAMLLSKVLPLFSIVPNTNAPGTLQATLHYIDLHYKQPLTREEIANAVGYSPSHIFHVFSGAMNMTLMEYITMLRMGEAKQLLRSTQLPVSRIAMQLGFSSIRSFNRFFLKESGISPTQYRKDNR